MLKLTVERERRGWSKSELARRARLEQGLIGKFEAGRIKPYPKQIERVARALGIAPERAETLLEEAAAPTPNAA